jgi:hypothetical protein
MINKYGRLLEKKIIPVEDLNAAYHNNEKAKGKNAYKN